MRLLEKRSKKEFYEINEMVAKTTPMRTHYNSSNELERWVWQTKKKTIGKLLRTIKYKKVLDVGCGDGGLFSATSEESLYTGVDISPTQLLDFKKSLDKKTGRKPNLVEADIMDLPFEDNSFDVAIACDVLEHAIDPIKVLSEIKRVVKNDGHVIFGIPNEELLELARVITFRFPIKSPDHLYATYPSDVRKYFPKVIYHEGIPLNLPFFLNLLNILVVRNEK